MADDKMTMDEEMAADWAAIREKFAEEPAETAQDTQPATDDDGAALDAPAEPTKAERNRDESGRFTKAAEKAAETPARATKADAAPAPAEPAKTAPEAATDGQQRDVNRPPSTWKPTARAEWEKLPPSVRAEIHRRESDFMNGQHQLLPDARIGASFRQIVEPYMGMIQAENGTPEGTVSDMLRTAAALRLGTQQQKLQAVLHVARQFNIDLSPLTGQAAQQQTPANPGQPQAYADPRVDQIMAHFQQQEVARQNAERADRESAVERWTNETDAQGQPLRPYVGDVMTEMLALVPQLRQSNPGASHAEILQMAYDRSTWAHPEIRGLLQQKQQTESEQRRRAENQQRVADAKRAASVNVPRRGALPIAPKPGTIDQTIADTARALGLVGT